MDQLIDRLVWGFIDPSLVPRKCQGYTSSTRNGWRYDLRGTHMVYMGSPEREEATFLLLPRATSCI